MYDKPITYDRRTGNKLLWEAAFHESGHEGNVWSQLVRNNPAFQELQPDMKNSL